MSGFLRTMSELLNLSLLLSVSLLYFCLTSTTQLPLFSRLAPSDWTTLSESAASVLLGLGRISYVLLKGP